MSTPSTESRWPSASDASGPRRRSPSPPRRASGESLGHTVYPFHLGDMDLPTPENIVEAAFRAIRDGKTGYCPNAGIPELREALAADVGASHGVAYAAGERRRPAGRQARHREVPPHAHGPRRRGPLPQPRVPHLREPDRVPRRRRQALRLRARREGLPARLRRHRGGHHAAHQRLLIFNNLHNPTGAESPDGGDRGAGRARP